MTDEPPRGVADWHPSRLGPRAGGGVHDTRGVVPAATPPVVVGGEHGARLTLVAPSVQIPDATGQLIDAAVGVVDLVDAALAVVDAWLDDREAIDDDGGAGVGRVDDAVRALVGALADSGFLDRGSTLYPAAMSNLSPRSAPTPPDVIGSGPDES